MKKIVVSIGFCVVGLFLFITAAAASRQELAAGLRKQYGDISGIQQLTIEGAVISHGGGYGYTFRIGPGRNTVRTMVFSNIHTFINFERQHSRHFSSSFIWHSSVFYTIYIPVGPYEIVVSESEYGFFTDIHGNTTPLPEYRVYGDIFEAEIIFSGRRLYVQGNLPDTNGRLFACIRQRGYLRIYRRYDNNIYVHRGFHAGSHQISPLAQRLAKHITIDDTCFIVPTGPHLFGDTAVYAVHMPNEVVLMGTENEDQRVVAQRVLPVSIERDQDEILGFLELDEDFILIIKRADGYELTRINPVTHESQIVFIEDDVTFFDYFLKGDSLILRGRTDAMYWMTANNVLGAIDLTGGDLVLAGNFRADLYERQEEYVRSPVSVFDMFLRNDVVYIAYSVIINPWEFRFPSFCSGTFISAFDMDGRLVGRAQVLNGVEDDTFTTWEQTGRTARFQRLVQTLRIY